MQYAVTVKEYTRKIIRKHISTQVSTGGRPTLHAFTQRTRVTYHRRRHI